MTAAKTKANVFSQVVPMLKNGYSDGLTNDAAEFMVDLEDIEIREQVREVFETEEQTLADLGKDLMKEQDHAILLRYADEDGAKPYILVCGERRVRAARLVGMTQLRARAKRMTVEQAEEAQLAENTHRLNLTQFEVAKRIKRDLATMSVDEVLAKHNKNRAWLSKIMSLLDLSPQAKRLITENVTHDLEAISNVRQIERIDPERAREVVDDLARDRRKINVREHTQAVKQQVKPPKKKAKDGGDAVATPRDRRHEEPSEGKSFAGAKPPKAEKSRSYEEALSRAYDAVFEGTKGPSAALNTLTGDQRSAAEQDLRRFFDAGAVSVDAAQVVIQGFRNGGFSPDGPGAFRLAAFLSGLQSKASGKGRFSIADLFVAMQQQ